MHKNCVGSMGLGSSNKRQAGYTLNPLSNSCAYFIISNILKGHVVYPQNGIVESLKGVALI